MYCLVRKKGPKESGEKKLKDTSSYVFSYHPFVTSTPGCPTLFARLFSSLSRPPSRISYIMPLRSTPPSHLLFFEVECQRHFPACAVIAADSGSKFCMDIVAIRLTCAPSQTRGYHGKKQEEVVWADGRQDWRMGKWQTSILAEKLGTKSKEGTTRKHTQQSLFQYNAPIRSYWRNNVELVVLFLFPACYAPRFLSLPPSLSLPLHPNSTLSSGIFVAFALRLPFADKMDSKSWIDGGSARFYPVEE